MKKRLTKKDYDIILQDRTHLTDYEKDQLIPELKLRLKALKQYFNEIINLCAVQKDSPVFNQAVQSVINPQGMSIDPKNLQKNVSESFFGDIGNVAKTQGVDDIEKILKEYEIIEDVKHLGLFLNEVNFLCSSLVAVNNSLLLYKIETYPYLTNVKTGQTAVTYPPQYTITIEPFQILVTNIVGVAKATSETIHEWHKYALKLKSQYLDLYTNRLSIKNAKLVLFIHILAIFLAISLSAFFLSANDPFNLYKENQKLKRNISELKKENIELKALKNKNLTSRFSGSDSVANTTLSGR